MRELNKALWPHKITLKTDEDFNTLPIETWAEEKFGKFRKQWNVVYRVNRIDYYFKNAKDATMFALRWV